MDSRQVTATLRWSYDIPIPSATFALFTDKNFWRCTSKCCLAAALYSPLYLPWHLSHRPRPGCLSRVATFRGDSAGASDGHAHIYRTGTQRAYETSRRTGPAAQFCPCWISARHSTGV